MATFFRGLSLARAGPSRVSAIIARTFIAPTHPTHQAYIPDDRTATSPSRPSTTSSYPSTTTPIHSRRSQSSTDPYGLESAKPFPIPGGSSAFPIPANLRPSSGTGPNDASSDAWWTQQSTQYYPRGALPGNQWAGRSFRVYAGDVMSAYRRLNGLLSRTGVKADVKRGEYFEKPSQKKRRLNQKRHRRRFQEMVREKVQTVQMIRNRD